MEYEKFAIFPKQATYVKIIYFLKMFVDLYSNAYFQKLRLKYFRKKSFDVCRISQ